MNALVLPSFRTLVMPTAFALASLAVFLPIVLPHAHAAAPILNVSATVTVPGASASIAGSGYGANEKIFLTFGKQTAEVTANAAGSFTTSLPIPAVPASLQFVSGWGESSGSWSLGYLWVAGFSPQVAPESYFILPGAALSFSGTGFAPHETVTAKYGATTLATYTTDASGAFSGSAASLPLPLNNTTAIVTFTGASSLAETSVTLTIGQLYASLAPSTWYTGAGSTIALTGSGFAGSEGISVLAGTKTASTTANASGAWTIPSFLLPSTGGPLAITATGLGSGASATANIFLTTPSPWLTFSTYWAQGGSPLTIFGNSFLPNETVGVSSPSGAIGTSTADTSGNFSLNTSVPFAPSGPITITGLGAASGASASGAITIAPVYVDLQLVNYAGAPGDAIQFIGHGYLPNEPVQVTTDRTGATVVATLITDASGNLNASYAVPAATTPGSMTLSIFGTHSFVSKSIVYYVTGG